ncbi:MAG: NB-ARC domain-containing protein [Rickettsia conorii subsp. raoultii]|uniref:LuxR C-terminal-related transcriptional regulator n=1 Tax=Rickettsia conorii subsp. raoultii TaxID=369822 RepID=A0ABY4U068_RICCR|nr:NB-ARC domain-containing protein [Rickettsia conorii]URW77545.1 LuxR C-terminal-related transcriptional regulator [Rickettsia conorii subsp. raoultii]URW77690.1 LuxR C-terminal-related transcriptional regulator [Rickettsia conorii subsp. raoultii]
MCPQEIYAKHLRVINNIRFTSREIDVIACIMHGKNIKGVANFLSNEDKQVETRTIESHISNIKRKIGTNVREGIINFMEKSDKYKLIQSYYLSLLIQQEFKKNLKEILILTKPYNISFFIVLQMLENNDLNWVIYKIRRDLQLVGITVFIELREYSDNVPIVLMHKGTHGEDKKQCTIYVLSVNKTNIPKRQSIVMSNDQDISKVFLLTTQAEQGLEFLPKRTNFEYINLSLSKQYHFIFLEIITKVFSNTNVENIIVKFRERYNNIMSNQTSSVAPQAYLTDKNIQAKVRNIYLPIVGVLVLIICSTYLLIFDPAVRTTVKSQEAEMPYLKPQESIIFPKNLTTWNIPRQDNVFVGREKLLNNLHNKLRQNYTPEGISNLAISACAGLGGIGKTQLTLQYVTHTKHPYTFKAWFPAENSDDLYNKYIEFAKLLGYTENIYTKENIIAYVKQWLVDNPGWLLVYDNVNNYREIAPFLPETGGHVILTTRQRYWPTKFSILPIDVMTEEESIKTIKTLIQRNVALGEENAIRELVEILGYLPLALVQASAYIKQKHITIPEYLGLYKKYESELLSDNSFLEETNNYSYPVAVTWNITLDGIVRDTSINNETPIAIELLIVCAYLAPDKISRKLLLTWLQTAHPDLSSPELTLNKHIALLWQYSMINYDNDNNISVHRLVQTVLRHQFHKILNKNNNMYPTLNLRWFESLLQFFIDHEQELTLTNSFQQIIETSQHFKTQFQDQYNENLIIMDLIVARIYLCQDKYKDFLKILDQVNTYLQKLDGLKMLKCEMLGLYSAYFYKIGNYHEAKEKLNKAFDEYNNIKINNSEKDNDMKILKAKLVYHKAKLVLEKNTETDKTNINTLEIENTIKSIQEAMILFKEANNTRNLLLSIRLYGQLLILTNQVDKVIIEFNKYNNLIEQIANDMIKMLFYITYSDVYFSKGDFNKALEYCGKAKQQAEKLHLNNKLDYLNNQEKTIKASLQ